VRVLTPVLLVAVALAGGCGKSKAPPRAGEACASEGRFVCSGDRAALFCTHGAYVEVACAGGCVPLPDPARCNDTFGDENAACMGDGYACSKDGAFALACTAGKWKKWRSCNGTKRCTIGKDGVLCDHSRADVGEDCDDADGAVACSSDGTELYACGKSHKLEKWIGCRGPAGCRTVGDAVPPTAVCDQSLARDDEACKEPTPHACGVDGRGILACTSGRWKRIMTCGTCEAAKCK
jgi:hypothetical protein